MGPFMYGDDFAFFSEKVPSLFIDLGTSSDDLEGESGDYRHNLPSNVPVHHGQFNVDERILARGAALYCFLATQSLQQLAGVMSESVIGFPGEPLVTISSPPFLHLRQNQLTTS